MRELLLKTMALRKLPRSIQVEIIEAAGPCWCVVCDETDIPCPRLVWHLLFSANAWSTHSERTRDVGICDCTIHTKCRDDAEEYEKWRHEKNWVEGGVGEVAGAIFPKNSGIPLAPLPSYG